MICDAKRAQGRLRTCRGCRWIEPGVPTRAFLQVPSGASDGIVGVRWAVLSKPAAVKALPLEGIATADRGTQQEHGPGSKELPLPIKEQSVHSRTPFLLGFRVELPPCHLGPGWRHRYGTSRSGRPEPGRAGNSGYSGLAQATRWTWPEPIARYWGGRRLARSRCDRNGRHFTISPLAVVRHCLDTAQQTLRKKFNRWSEPMHNG